MEVTGGVATWLELAVAPEWRKRQSKIRLHAVGGEEGGCFALSMDGRWLCASGGRLTLFRGREAAEHFLKAVRIDRFEIGEPPPRKLCCDGRHFGLRLDRKGCLTACRPDHGVCAPPD